MNFIALVEEQDTEGSNKRLELKVIKPIKDTVSGEVAFRVQMPIHMEAGVLLAAEVSIAGALSTSTALILLCLIF